MADLTTRIAAAIFLDVSPAELDEISELTRVHVRGVTHYIAQEITALKSARARAAKKETIPSGDGLDLSGCGVKWGSPTASDAPRALRGKATKETSGDARRVDLTGSGLKFGRPQ